MNQKQLRVACRDAGIRGYGEMTVAAMRTALEAVAADMRAVETKAAELSAPKTKKSVVVRKTEPLRKVHQVRILEIEKATRVNLHHNDDGSITVYAAREGVKIWRSAGEREIEAGEVADDYDAEEALQGFLKRWFGRKPVVIGRVTHGHRWKSKKPSVKGASDHDARQDSRAHSEVTV